MPPVLPAPAQCSARFWPRRSGSKTAPTASAAPRPTPPKDHPPVPMTKAKTTDPNAQTNVQRAPFCLPAGETNARGPIHPAPGLLHRSGKSPRYCRCWLQQPRRSKASHWPPRPQRPILTASEWGWRPERPPETFPQVQRFQTTSGLTKMTSPQFQGRSVPIDRSERIGLNYLASVVSWS